MASDLVRADDRQQVTPAGSACERRFRPHGILTLLGVTVVVFAAVAGAGLSRYRANQQQLAAISRIGGSGYISPLGPHWLRSRLGIKQLTLLDKAYGTVNGVLLQLPRADTSGDIRVLSTLPHLKVLTLSVDTDYEDFDFSRSPAPVYLRALPRCRVEHTGSIVEY